MRNTEEIVFEVLGNISGVSEINESQTLTGDLALDSLNMVLILVMLEDEMGIEFDQSHLNPFDLVTVRDVIKLASLYVKGSEDE